MTTSSTPTKAPRRLNAAQVAQQCRRRGMPIATNSVRRWARDQRLPHWRTVTGRILFDPAVVEHLLHECKTETGHLTPH